MLDACVQAFYGKCLGLIFMPSSINSPMALAVSIINCECYDKTHCPLKIFSYSVILVKNCKPAVLN